MARRHCPAVRAAKPDLTAGRSRIRTNSHRSWQLRSPLHPKNGFHSSVQLFCPNDRPSHLGMHLEAGDIGRLARPMTGSAIVSRDDWRREALLTRQQKDNLRTPELSRSQRICFSSTAIRFPRPNRRCSRARQSVASSRVRIGAFRIKQMLGGLARSEKTIRNSSC
jgi:hypothetical protein